jgi:phage terminase large subunit
MLDGPLSVDEILARAMHDRVFFVEQCLESGGHPIILEKWQREALQAIDRGETRISIRSGHGVGKTFFAGVCSLHMLLFTRDTKIVVTSPSSSQLKDGLIPETKLLIGRLRYGLQDLITLQTNRIVLTEDPDNNFISYRTARIENPEALQGIHASNVMVIADEASGIPEPVYEAARGTMSTEGAIFVLIGNPTRGKGLFYRTHTILKDLWWTRQVSCMDSTRVTKDFIEEMRRTYGEASNQWRIRVLGDFPTTDEDSIIPRELAEPALDRDVDAINDDHIWGVDPGRGGDPTGFIVRAGNLVTFAKELHFADTMRVVGWVYERWQNAAPDERPRLICVDAIGVGAGVADRLRQMGLPVMDVNVAESPAMRDRFPRLRAELWFGVRGWFERRDVRIACDRPLAEKLVNELCEPGMIITSTGKTDVESKAQMKQRGVASPNLADALCLTFAADGGIASGAAGSSQWNLLPWNKSHPKRLEGF